MIVKIGDSELDVAPDTLPAFTYSWTDLQEIDRARGSRSTSMTLPVTSRNRLALGGYSTSEDTSSRRLPFSVTAGGTTVLFTGEALVTERGPDAIGLTAYGDNAAWMPFLKETKLRDFDFGEEIEITNQSIRGSWNDQSTALYFPLVDYGAIGQIAPGGNVPNELFRPGIRIATILERVFASAGYAVEAKGSFADLWRRLVTCNTFDRIEVGPSTQADNDATFEATNPTNGSTTNPVPTTATIDQGAHYVSPGRYTSALDATFNILCEITGQANGNGVAFVILWDYTNGTQVAIRPITIGTSPNNYTVDFGDVEFDSATDYGVYVNPLFGVGFTISSFSVEFTLLDVPYQDNIFVTPAACCPNITASELLRRIMVSQCLVAYTRNNTVELWYYDEFYTEPDSTCIDLTSRLAQPPITSTDEQPSAYSFEHERDSNDLTLEGYGQEWADGRYVVAGGALEEKTIEVGYTVSAMGNVLGGLSVPRLIDKDDPTVDVYDREDRILIDGGYLTADWVQNGESLTRYPYAYSVAPAPFTVAFGDVERANSRGTVSTRYALKMRHATGPMLEADIYWHDHEVAEFNPRKPVRINDGQMSRWYYVAEITQHRFGMGRPTRTKLIPR